MTNEQKVFPDWITMFNIHEILLYACLVLLAYLIGRLFFYHSVERAVRKESRCLREAADGERSGTYLVTATNAKNKNLYTISYDLADKSYTASCACPNGKTLNQFDNISVYDMKNPSNPVRKDYAMNCYCDRDYVSGMKNGTDTLYYSGYPGLQRFMRNADTSFFET